MSVVSNAVFLSYASEDTETAERIATALRSAGIEVWFDKSELRGGDSWDRQIRNQIHDCRLFVAVISAHTEARDEGYFRREWRLAVERTGDMHERRAFLVPVVIDGTIERGAAVPEKFRELQWTRLPGGETPSAFVDRIKRLLSPGSPATSKTAANGDIAQTLARASSTRSAKRPLLAAAVVAIVGAAAYLAYERPWAPQRAVPSPPPPAGPASATATAFNPPPHSIAVLPFVNLGGDKDQEYFSDGLTEELLNALSQINDLQVAARTSSFSFREHPDIVTVAHKLNVAAVLEGSVRRSEHTVRVTAQLINAVTGFHLWSKTYDRDIGDVLKLQTEIATAVAEALQVTLLGDVAAKIELGGTRNASAFDAYLHGSKVFASYHGEKDLQAAIEAFTEAIRLDPHYALAFAGRSRARLEYAGQLSPTPEIRKRESDQAGDDARQAVAMAPELAEGHLALAQFFENGAFDFGGASKEYQRARALAPGNATILRLYGYFTARMGHTDAGLAALQRAVVLDPLDRGSHRFLADALFDARQYDAAIAATQDALAIDPHDPYTLGLRGVSYYALGRFESARGACVNQPEHWTVQQCLALAYHKLGYHADAEAALTRLMALQNDNAAYQYAEIFAQWGKTDQALDWLETALRLRDPGLYSTRVDPLLDPLRKEPRFQAIEKALKFPE